MSLWSVSWNESNMSVAFLALCRTELTERSVYCFHLNEMNLIL